MLSRHQEATAAAEDDVDEEADGGGGGGELATEASEPSCAMHCMHGRGSSWCRLAS
jgi:hypothetical protein